MPSSVNSLINPVHVLTEVNEGTTAMEKAFIHSRVRYLNGNDIDVSRLFFNDRPKDLPRLESRPRWKAIDG